MLKNKNIIYFFLPAFLIGASLIFYGVMKSAERLEPIKNKEINYLNDNNMVQKNIRTPAVAGGFYPADHEELKAEISKYLAQARAVDGQGELKAIIVPHAGTIYSGQAAAESYKQVRPEKINNIVIIGPSHYFPVRGISASSADFWQTPLGNVKIAKTDFFPVNDKVHEPEHSLEIQLPFLQVVFGQRYFTVSPLVVGYLSDEERYAAASQIERYLGNGLLVVSVDLSHYHPADKAKELDEKSISAILALDEIGVNELEIDSPDAVKILISLAKKNNWQPKLLKYYNSGDISNDYRSVVGYAAIAFYGNISESAAEIYSQEEKRELLEVARQAISDYLFAGKTYSPQTENAKLKEKRGAFVTLHKQGQLRGCIGYIEPIEPLIEAVRDNAISAAFNDSRFAPLSPEEFDEIDIEISVLTLPQKTSIADINPEQDGVIIKSGAKQATYLPQVWEQLPDKNSFFSSLCQKAGLPSNCWQSKSVEIYKYQAIVFSEITEKMVIKQNI